MAHVKAGSKELRKLSRRLKGCHLESKPGGAKTVLVANDTGQVVRYPDGRPVSMPASPEPGTLRDLTKRLERLDLVA